MLLSIIIVSFDTQKFLVDCLNSIYKESSKDTTDNIEVIVVDNASSDKSVELVKKNFPQVKLIENEKNQGFAKANNIGIKNAVGEFILLLNSDTILPPHTLESLLNYIKENKDLDVLGIKLLNSDHSVQYSLGYLPNLFNILLWMTFLDDLPFLKKILPAYHISDKDFYDHKREVGWVSGAFFLIGKHCIEEIGSLDEQIFMYGEEVEWCQRLKNKGFKVIYSPSIEIIHLKGKSGSGKYAGIIEEFKALEYFFSKHKPAWQKPLLRLILKVGALLRLILFGIISGDREKATIYAKAFKMA